MGRGIISTLYEAIQKPNFSKTEVWFARVCKLKISTAKVFLNRVLVQYSTSKMKHLLLTMTSHQYHFYHHIMLLMHVEFNVQVHLYLSYE